MILITADKTARFAEIDCALTAENILIAAESLGLGSIIMTSTEFLFKSEKGEQLKKELGIPEGYEHVCTIALGYEDENRRQNQEKRRNQLRKIISQFTRCRNHKLIPSS